MSVGSRFRSYPEAPSLKSTLGAALVGVALLGGTAGMTLAQDASPEASPSASPVAVATWIESVEVEAEVDIDGDSSAVGVKVGEIAEINVASIEVRPYIILQTANNTDSDMMAAVFMVPEGMDPATFVFPASEADLPEGVTAIGGYEVPAGGQTAAVFTDLVPGSYVLATDTGLSVPFTVTEVVPLDVPDLFASPEA
jgi:hypothetical protein